jgi:hypothetical protein
MKTLANHEFVIRAVFLLGANMLLPLGLVIQDGL